MKNIIYKIGIGLGAFVLLLLGTLLYLSPQKTADFKGAEGKPLANSIAEIVDLELNGVSQRLVIRGKNKANPVLLHIHGGPGFPDYAFIKESGANIEDLFTVCYWEQRGAAASFNENIPAQSMSLQQIVADGEALTQYLRKRFKKDKIYVQGHSWGTTVGTFLAQKSPELYQAYIGIGQMANSRLSEQVSYDFALAAAKKANNRTDIKLLEKIGRPPYQTAADWLNAVMPERTIMRKYENPKGKPPKSLFDFYKTFILYRAYSIGDKLKIAKGEAFSMQNLWMEAINVNLFEQVPSLGIPVYILQGKYDKHTCTAVAKNYFDSLKAPMKKYFEFEYSGHDPHLTEFEKYREVIQTQILKN